MDCFGDVVRPRPGAAVSADGGVSSAGTWCGDSEVQAQDPVQPVAEDGRDLGLRCAGLGRCASEDADCEHDADGGDRDGRHPRQDCTPPSEALRRQRRGETGSDGSIADAARCLILGGSLQRIM